jgi:chromosome segregation ATPase
VKDPEDPIDICPLRGQVKGLRDKVEQTAGQLAQSQKELTRLTEQTAQDAETIKLLSGQVTELTDENRKIKLAFEASRSLLSQALRERGSVEEDPKKVTPTP